jgi:hypothetical protein
MCPLPTPVNCEHPRLVKLVKFKGEHVVYYRCELAAHTSQYRSNNS